MHMIYFTNSNYDKFRIGENGIIYHNYDFCKLANSDYFIQGLPDIEENSGLREVSSEINPTVIQKRRLKKCSWCEQFAASSTEIQNEYLQLQIVSIEHPTVENLARFMAFSEVYLL